MSIAPRIEAHLARVGVEYVVIEHSHSINSIDSAQAAHVPVEQLAKAILTRSKEPYIDGTSKEYCYRMCVIPANHKLVMPWLNKHLGAHFTLVPENELPDVLDDCELGAVPPLGQVYGAPVVWDKSLMDMPEVYLESGDHRNLIQLKRGSFLELMGRQDYDVISCSIDEFKQGSHLIH